jgi:hypothetical protein
MQRANCPIWIQGGLVLCALLASPAAAQTCIEPPSGLRGWWPGEGDSIDLQSGLHGVALNGAGYGAGMVGEAFAFNGIDEGMDDRVDLPPSALAGLTDMTIEMWVQSQDQMAAIFSGAGDQGPGTSNETFLFLGATGTAVATRQTGTGFVPVFLNDGAWHHVAITRSGALGTLYVDGVAEDVRTVPPEAFEIGPGGLMLGQEQDCLGGCLDPSQGLDGMVDEFSIYDRALSQAEVVAIFDAAGAGKCKPLSNAELLREIEDLDFEIETLLDRIDELEANADESDRLIVELETEVATLLDQISELEANATPVIEHPCKNSRDWRGCWKSRAAHIKKGHKKKGRSRWHD